MKIQEEVGKILLSQKLSSAEKRDRLRALIPADVCKIDDVNQATPVQLRQLKDGIMVTDCYATDQAAPGCERMVIRKLATPPIPRAERFLVAFSLWPARPVASSEIELKSLSNFRAIGQSSYFAKQDLLFLGVSSNIAGSLCGFGHDDTYRPGQRLALHSSPSGFLQPPARLFLTVDVSLTRTNQEFARH
jgi:hypothetical protein